MADASKGGEKPPEKVRVIVAAGRTVYAVGAAANRPTHHGPGAEVMLDADNAKRLVASGHVRRADAPPPAADAPQVITVMPAPVPTRDPEP